jgi:hypothetical protein
MLCRMAEKPTSPPLPYPFGEREGAKIAPELAEVLRLLAERGKATTIEGLRALLDPAASAQKRSAEPGQVDLMAANEWLIARWPSPRPCPLCNHEEWAIAGSLAHIPTSAIGLHMPPRVNPCVAVVCGHCGNTVFLNAIIMGLLPKSEE